MIIKLLFSIIAFIIPVFPGILLINRKRDSIGISDFVECYVLGQIGMWGVFQLIGVLMVRLKCSFRLLYYFYIAFVLLSVIFAVLFLSKHRIKLKRPGRQSALAWILLSLTVMIILFQMVMYAFGMHIDDDDARWIAQANDAVTQNSMFLIDPSTGEYFGGAFVGDMVRDSISPWPMYLAVLSAFTGFRPAVIAHTVYAPVLLAFSYLVYARMSTRLFKGKDERIIFLFLVSILTLFFSGCGDTSADFLLIRIWQGKAVVAGIMIPALFSQFLAIQQEDTIRNWVVLFLMGCASCLVSGMGIVISIIMIGLFGIYFVFARKWKRIPCWILTLAFPVLFECYFQFWA